MAETTKDQQIIESKDADPIVDRSMSGIMLISALVLTATLLWALYDEMYGLRPWKRVQKQYVTNYLKFLKRQTRPQREREKEIRESPEYQKVEQEMLAAEEAAKPRVKEIDAELAGIERQVLAITATMQDPRSLLAAYTYDLEQASESGKKKIRDKIEDVRKGPFELKLPSVDGAKVETKKVSYTDLENMFTDLKDRKAKLSAERVQLLAKATDLRKQRDAIMQEQLVGLTETQIAGLINKMENFSYEIKQINVPEANIVDRCMSCHLGMREPMTLTRASLRQAGIKKPSKAEVAAFISHPNRDLLAKHDPDRFGCSPCHGGNGRATNSVYKAHGKNKHWLWPLYDKENTEAGCQQCHAKDMVLAGATTLNLGKELYQTKGCVGCHRYEGFDRETDALFNTTQTIKSLYNDRKAKEIEIQKTAKLADTAASNEEAQRLNAQVDSLRIAISTIDSKIDQLKVQSKHLMQDQKKLGPNLKEARVKLRKEWIPVWLEDNFKFRPDTKMPRFRLTQEEIQALSAYIWQSALTDKLATQPTGDAVRGKQAFETRGCLACHSMGENGSRVGNNFAANLSRLGEKANYDYVVRWIHNPRVRTRPYCPKEKRDIGPEDYAKKGLPYIFDSTNSRCPNDGEELQVQNMTVMPSLRLSEQETRDIATYLISLKRADAQYPAASAVAFMDDPNLKEKGKAVMKNYGCASCHEVSGLEDEGRIGTELTEEGVKPIERLDFGLLEHDFKKEGKYNHKQFFVNKIDQPDIYDKGKEKAPKDRLKMPEPNVNEDEIKALTTFLLGSVGKNASIPMNMYYAPTDQRRDIQEGWYLIRKYNCMGCHNVMAGQKPGLELNVPLYQNPDWKEQIPPSLTSEGARVDPNWLMRFLSDPSMSDVKVNKFVSQRNGGGQAGVAEGPKGTQVTGTSNGGAQATPANNLSPALNPVGADRNGVRPYLVARMPTFNFSPNELRILVKFFEAISSQPQPYIAAEIEPLTENEKGLARALFTSTAAPCLKCHLTGDAAAEKTKNAPNFLLAPERLRPAWTGRWLIDPQLISPGTAMPSGLFKREGERWVFNGALPDTFKSYDRDHVELLVRYMFTLTPDEQRRIAGSGGGGSAPAAATSATSTGARPPRPALSMNRRRGGTLTRGVMISH